MGQYDIIKVLYSGFEENRNKWFYVSDVEKELKKLDLACQDVAGKLNTLNNCGYIIMKNEINLSAKKKLRKLYKLSYTNINLIRRVLGVNDGRTRTRTESPTSY